MSQVIMMALFKFIGLFTFSHGGTGIKKGVWPFVVVCWHFHVEL